MNNVATSDGAVTLTDREFLDFAEAMCAELILMAKERGFHALIRPLKTTRHVSRHLIEVALKS
jgi:hypothetical protein